MLLQIDLRLALYVVSSAIALGMAYYAVLLLLLMRKGILEKGWRYTSAGAVLLALSIAVGAVLQAGVLPEEGILSMLVLLSIGVVYILIGLRAQYLIWKNKLFPLSTVQEVLENFIAAKTPAMKPSTSPLARKALSQELNLAHGQLVGKKILLEFDPASNYEEHVKKFIHEALTNNQTAVVFTKQGSNIASLGNVKVVVLSVSEQALELLPEGNLKVSITNASILLEAFNRVLNSFPQTFIVVDSLSDMVLNLGFERTHKLLQQVSERMTNRNSSILLLFNPKVHDEKVKAVFEAYANILLKADKSGLHLIKA